MLAYLPENAFIFAPEDNLQREIISISARRLENKTRIESFSPGVLEVGCGRGGECANILAAFVIAPSFAWDVFGFSDRLLSGSNLNQGGSLCKFKF